MSQSKNIKSSNKRRKTLLTVKDQLKNKKITSSKVEISNCELESKNVQEKKKSLDILKRGRKFVDKDTMMNLIDQLNEDEDERIEKKLQRQNNLEQIIEDREIKKQRNQSIRKEKLEKVKQSIKKKKQLKRKKNKLGSKTS
ncbi:8549_t:CDS:2 [Funneliformis geosporum]|uniref:1442_t:CDS:1 n=1 Tax=Funneliformis geosporum TaxID=1117311 RepID=A0A9W4T2D7_9GLOM|nr:1442_t:CDS:2 [Funneliformis geosporum]CAI2192570.1 8549_t:CDS:2 [Funneliformis geosporum]